MAGDVWFYYGSRYGEYLEITHQGDPEDWLPAELELSPGLSSAYFDSARHYQDIGDLPHATDDYLHALELAPKRADCHYHLAEIYWWQGHQDEALTEWRKALEALKNQISAKSTYVLPESFASDYSSITANLGSHGLVPQFRAQMDALLHIYVRYSDWYALTPILRSSLSDPKDARETTALVLELSHDAHNQLDFLDHVAQPKAKLHLQMETIYRRILELAQKKRETEKTYDSRYILHDWQMRWFAYLLDAKQYARLRSEIDALIKTTKTEKATKTEKTARMANTARSYDESEDDSDDENVENQQNLVKIQIRLAAATNSLDPLLESFNESDHAPGSKLLKATARELQQAGDRQSARKILEFVFRREVENHNLNAANVLALAEIRIEAGEVQSAVELMRRMTLVAGAPFETQEPAAALLMRTGHPQEAISFLKELVNAAPWNAGYRASLAQAQVAGRLDTVAAHRMLAAVATDKTAPYEVRVSSAKALQPADASVDLGSRELKLLASGQPLTVEEANQPFFWAARLQASQRLEPARRAHLLRLALEDYPHGDLVRPILLKIAMNTNDYHLAVASMKPLVRSHWLEVKEYYASSWYRQPDEDEDEDADVSPEAVANLLQADSEDEQKEPTALDKVPAREKAEIARQVGMALEKLDQLEEAIPYFKEAKRLETGVAARKQIDDELGRIREVQSQRKENSTRQPHIHDELEQTNIVRPRLAVAAPLHQRVPHESARSTR
jgi:tetratricopeptide (TPR) repeat protein